MSDQAVSTSERPGTRVSLLCPFDITAESVTRFLNAELADHPLYDGFELQWFDDGSHGTGMLAFLSRREDRRVDYYVQSGLQLDPAGYEIGGGIGRWTETTFEVARLEVGPDGVEADVHFADVEGRRIEIRVDDRAAGRRQPADLLAPIGAGVENPASLLLVYMHGFELVRRGGPDPVVRIDGEEVSTGRLPGGFLHGRHLIKAAAPLSVAMVCQAMSGPLNPVDPAAPGTAQLDPDGRGIRGVVASQDGVSTRLQLAPSLPLLAEMTEGATTTGAWRVTIDDATITGGTWQAIRHGTVVDLGLDVTRRWKPAPGLPWLMRIVTRVVPTFRRWPTTYHWRARVTLDGPPRMESGWERTEADRGERYRRATRS